MYVLEGEGKVERGKKIRKVVKLSVQRKHSFLHCFFFFFFFSNYNRFWKEWPLRAICTHARNENNWSVEVFWARLASFGQLSIINDLQIILQNSQNGFRDHKGPENINKTTVKSQWLEHRWLVFRVEPFPKGVWCRTKQTEKCKSCEKLRKIFQVVWGYLHNSLNFVISISVFCFKDVYWRNNRWPYFSFYLIKLVTISLSLNSSIFSSVALITDTHFYKCSIISGYYLIITIIYSNTLVDITLLERD